MSLFASIPSIPDTEAPRPKLKPSIDVELLPKDKWFYAAVSGLQKAIRRGLADDAVLCARRVYASDRSWKLQHRIRTICFEDVAFGDLSLAMEIWDKTQAHSSLSEMEESCRRLAAATKNRDLDCGGHILYSCATDPTRGKSMFPDQDEIDFYKAHFVSYDKDDSFKHQEFWAWAKQEASSKPALSPIIDWLSDRSAKTKLGWYSVTAAILLIYRTDAVGRLPQPTIRTTPKFELETKYLSKERGILLAAIDGHVLHGKMAIQAATKRYGDEIGKQIHGYMFFSEGAILDKWAAFGNDYRGLAMKFLYPNPPQSLEDAFEYVQNARYGIFERAA